MTDGISTDHNRPRVWRVYLLGVLVVLGLFYLHAMLLFDVTATLLRAQPGLLQRFSPVETAKIIVVGSFVILFVAHLIEASLWGIFLRWTGLLRSFPDAIYFSVVSISTLGYGDLVLPTPWRQLGPMIGIAGVLMFGCSTAFLFVLMQAVWVKVL
jgi:hypothetical protein